MSWRSYVGNGPSDTGDFFDINLSAVPASCLAVPAAELLVHVPSTTELVTSSYY